MKRIKFYKMHGLGNDFVVINRLFDNIDLSPDIIASMACRHTGIGFDQLLILDPPTRPGFDFFYRIYNSDGSSAGQCGNGARCVTLLAQHLQLFTHNKISIQTASGAMTATITNSNTVIVDMGPPEELTTSQTNTKATAYIDDNEWQLVSMGNPHAITFTQNLELLDIEPIALKLQSNPLFTDSVNVGFVHIISDHTAKLRVYERGAGETLACGSGACAAAVSAIRTDQAKSPLTLKLAKGELKISWKPGSSVMMEGPASLVYEGTFFHPKPPVE